MTNKKPDLNEQVEKLVAQISKMLSGSSKRKRKFSFQVLDSGCIVCTSHAKNFAGYLRLMYNGKMLRAHPAGEAHPVVERR